MRIAFSLAALLVVVFIVMKLAATQTRALQPLVAPTAGASGVPATTAPQAAAVQGQVQRALEQGAAALAERAASQ